MRNKRSFGPREVDLFGEPILPPPPPGRPRHEPTSRQRALAKRLRREGAPQFYIAKRLGITVPTLVRHYAGEIGSSSKIGGQYDE